MLSRFQGFTVRGREVFRGMGLLALASVAPCLQFTVPQTNEFKAQSLNFNEGFRVSETVSDCLEGCAIRFTAFPRLPR